MQIWIQHKGQNGCLITSKSHSLQAQVHMSHQLRDVINTAGEPGKRPGSLAVSNESLLIVIKRPFIQSQRNRKESQIRSSYLDEEWNGVQSSDDYSVVDVPRQDVEGSRAALHDLLHTHALLVTHTHGDVSLGHVGLCGRLLNILASPPQDTKTRAVTSAGKYCFNKTTVPPIAKTTTWENVK